MKTIISLNSSQIKQFLSCNMFWNLRSAQGLGTINETRKDALDWGTLVHYVLEHYYRARWKSDGLEEATEAMKFRDKRVPKDDTLSINDIWNLYPDKQEFLLTRMKQYLGMKAMMGRDWRPKYENAVELGFSTSIYEDDTFIFALEGRIDLLESEGAIVDHKTQSRLSFLSLHRPQFYVYCLGAQTDRFIINYFMLTEKFESKWTFRVEGDTYRKSVLDYYRNYLITNVFAKIAQWKIEKNHGACAGVYDANECMYTSHCFEPSEEVAESILRHKFVKIQPRRSW